MCCLEILNTHDVNAQLINAMDEYSSFRSCVPMRKIEVDECGEEWIVFDCGPREAKCPLVFLPPLTGKADCYFKQMTALASKGYRCISAEWPEYWNIQEFCHAFSRFLDAMGLHKIHIFGASLGGYLAQKFAEVSYKSYKVASLILCNSFVDTDIFGRNDASFFYWALPGILLRKYVASGLTLKSEDKQIRNSLQFMLNSLECVPRSVLASRLTLNCGRSYCNTNKVSKLPITVIDVFDDCALSELARQNVHRAYPNARKAHLKDGGNFPFLSRGAEVNVFIEIHLSQFEDSPLNVKSK